MKDFVVLNIGPFKELIKDNIWIPDSYDQHTLQPYYVHFMLLPLQDMGYNVSVKDFEDIDKSKNWFINLNIGCWDPSMDLWSNIPSILLNELIFGNAYLIMNSENEYNTTGLFNTFNIMYSKNPQVPIHKLIFLSAALNCKENYNIWAESHNIPKKERLTVLYSCHIDLNFSTRDNFLTLSNSPHSFPKTKKYTLLNRELRLHRPYLVSLLAEKDILNKGYVSLGAGTNHINASINAGGWANFLKSTLSNSDDPKHQLIIEDIRSGIDKIHDKIPICLDKQEFNTNYASYDDTPIDYIKDSYFSLVTSTHFFKWQEESPGWNEKEWKPVMCRHPFIIVNRPHTLKCMRQIGILTFNNWFDESYDDIEDDWLRLKAIVDEVERLSNLSDEEWFKIYDEVSHILEYNRWVILEKLKGSLFYNTDLKEFLKFI